MQRLIYLEKKKQIYFEWDSRKSKHPLKKHCIVTIKNITSKYPVSSRIYAENWIEVIIKERDVKEINIFHFKRID